MAFHLIASHIQDEREHEVDQARLERLARATGGVRRSIAQRIGAALGTRLISLGQALGGEAVRPRHRGGSPLRMTVL